MWPVHFVGHTHIPPPPHPFCPFRRIHARIPASPLKISLSGEGGGGGGGGLVHFFFARAPEIILNLCPISTRIL